MQDFGFWGPLGNLAMGVDFGLDFVGVESLPVTKRSRVKAMWTMEIRMMCPWLGADNTGTREVSGERSGDGFGMREAAVGTAWDMRRRRWPCL